MVIDLEKNKSITLILSLDNYSKKNEIIRDIQKKNKHFIDAISNTIASEKLEVKNVIFVGSPQRLVKIALSIKQELNEKDQGVLFFDAVSTLLNYNDLNTILKFLHDITTTISQKKMKSLFLVLDEDSEKKLVSNLTMFTDNVIKM